MYGYRLASAPITNTVTTQFSTRVYYIYYCIYIHVQICSLMLFPLRPVLFLSRKQFLKCEYKMLWQVTFKLISNISFCSPSLLPFKGTVSRDSFYPAFPMTFTHLAPLFICISIFASGFDFAEIFAGTKMSVVKKTLQSFDTIIFAKSKPYSKSFSVLIRTPNLSLKRRKLGEGGIKILVAVPLSSIVNY